MSSALLLDVKWRHVTVMGSIRYEVLKRPVKPGHSHSICLSTVTQLSVVVDVNLNSLWTSVSSHLVR